MNPTKEELDAIQSYKDRVREILYYMPEIDSGLQKIGIIEAILTRYRDGELAEKKRFEVSVQVRNGQKALVHNGDVICLFTNEGKLHIETIVGILNPPTNQTEP